jgi:hypothetical protein
MHRGPEITAFLAISILLIGLGVPAVAQPEPDADSPQEADAEPAAEEETPAEDEEAGDDEEEYADEDDDYDYDYDDIEIDGGQAVEKEMLVVRPDAELGLELGSYFRSAGVGTTLELSPLIGTWFSVSEAVDVVLDWGFVFRNFSPDEGDTQTTFGMGNPYVGVRRVLIDGRTLIHFGVGVAAPVSSVPDNDDEDYSEAVAAYMTAAAMRGLYDLWLWMPEHIGFAVPLGARMESEDAILVGAETAFSVLIPIDNYRDHRSDFYIQLAAEIGYGSEVVDTGMRLQGVLTATNPDEDMLQMSFGPFVRVDVEGGYFEALALAILDTPYGVFGENSPDIWGLHLGGGAKF